jgi:transposase
VGRAVSRADCLPDRTDRAFTDHATRPFIREKFTKERTAARKLAAEYFERYPKERYQTEIESWRHPQSQNIELSR